MWNRGHRRKEQDHDQQHEQHSVDISMNNQKLEEMTGFKYLGASLRKNGTSSAEIHVRITAAMARLNRIWQWKTISFASKFKLYKSLVTSILLYGCETWTLDADSEKRSQAFETKCMRKVLCISYLEHKTNNWVWSKINFLVGLQEPLLATVKRQKLSWFGYVTRHDSLSKTILQCTLEGGRRRGRQRKCWMDNIKVGTSLPMSELLTRASCRKAWKKMSAESSLMFPRMTRSVKGLNWIELNFFFIVFIYHVCFYVYIYWHL